MADQEHKPQSGDRNNDYVARDDKPQQVKDGKATEEGERKADELSRQEQGAN